MLVLSRQIGEQLKIGDDITLVVKRISGNRVSIGVIAPRETKVMRGELLDAVRETRRGGKDPGSHE